MDVSLRRDADHMIRRILRAVRPGPAVSRVLERVALPGRITLISVGKAAWQMARAAVDHLGGRVQRGIVITKTGHLQGPLDPLLCFEAGHPIPDARSFSATRQALALTRNLTPEDTVLFLLSGGGSALFEYPLVPGVILRDVTDRLLRSGADIVEINTIRKRLSAVKGGRFARHCAPARITSIVLSDVLGDPLDMIASGPAYPDRSTAAEALSVVRKYGLSFPDEVMRLLRQETPKTLPRVSTALAGNVRGLCQAAAAACRGLGYEPIFLTDRLCCEAREAGIFLGSILKTHAGGGKKRAWIAGGETVVHVTGSGKGGRNQELALSAARALRGLPHAALFSLGSDGTDGPTDAAGGYVDGDTCSALASQGLSVDAILSENNAYPALQAIGGLLRTGPTGTNVNDVSVAFLDE